MNSNNYLLLNDLTLPLKHKIYKYGSDIYADKYERTNNIFEIRFTTGISFRKITIQHYPLLTLERTKQLYNKQKSRIVNLYLKREDHRYLFDYFNMLTNLNVCEQDTAEE